MSEDARSDTFEQLFPDQERRRLAEAFVERVTTVPGVEGVGLVETGSRKRYQRVFVFTEGFGGIVTADELMGVLEVVQALCPTNREYELLNVAPAITRSEFEGDRLYAKRFNIGAPVMLWQKPRSPETLSPAAG